MSLPAPIQREPGLDRWIAFNEDGTLTVSTGKVEIGGIARGTKHPNGKDFAFGPQMVEISRDGKIRLSHKATLEEAHGRSSNR